MHPLLQITLVFWMQPTGLRFSHRLETKPRVVAVDGRGCEPEIIKAEAVFLAMGFLKPQQPEFAENVFVAGDAASGASLVVRAMASGRKIAAQVDKFLNK